MIQLPVAMSKKEKKEKKKQSTKLYNRFIKWEMKQRYV